MHGTIGRDPRQPFSPQTAHMLEVASDVPSALTIGHGIADGAIGERLVPQRFTGDRIHGTVVLRCGDLCAVGHAVHGVEHAIVQEQPFHGTCIETGRVGGIERQQLSIRIDVCDPSACLTIHSGEGTSEVVATVTIGNYIPHIAIGSWRG